MKAILFSLFFFSASLLFAQPAQFLGLNPSITVEPDYNTGDFDINVCPLVYQVALLPRFDFRFTSIVNWGRRTQSPSALSHLGGEFAALYFFKLREQRQEPLSSWFLAPVVSYTYNRLERHGNTGLWAEGGYQLLFDTRVSLLFGFQVGATHFNYAHKANEWGLHIGGKFIVGYWF